MVSRLGSVMWALLLVLIAAVVPGPWGRTPTPGPLVPSAKSPHSGRIQRGAALFRELDCMRCHTEARTGHGTNVPASLRGAGSRSRQEWLSRYILQPLALRYRSEGRRPGLRMPALVVDSSDARDLAALLSTWRDTVLVPPVDGAEAWSDNDALVVEGRNLFEQYQCRGCHRLEGSGVEIGPSLDRVGDRRRAAYVFALIQDPDRLIPGTAMENKSLWPEEARAITAYLMTRRHDPGRR